MNIMSASAAAGLYELSGRLLEVFRLRRDGSFFTQQRFLAQLKEEEAAAAQLRETERDWRQAVVSVEVKAELDRRERQIVNMPFSHPVEDVEQLVRTATQDGQRPALLIAPFHNERSIGKEDGEPHTFRTALRNSWRATPWFEDLACLDGLISRPLSKTDVDVLQIRQSLIDLPIVMIYGEIQGDTRVWASIAAWNLTGSDQSWLHIAFPALTLPHDDGGRDAQQARLDFEDLLGAQVTLSAGVLGQWFHLVRYGREPDLNQAFRSIPQRERLAISAGLVAACDSALERGVVDIRSSKLWQARLYAEAEAFDQAVVLASSLLEEVVENQIVPKESTVDLLQALVKIFESCASESLAQNARSKLEYVSRQIVLDSLGWGGED